MNEKKILIGQFGTPLTSGINNPLDMSLAKMNPGELTKLDGQGNFINKAINKFAKSKIGSFMGSPTGNIIGSASNLISSFIPDKDLSTAKRGNLAQGLNKGYDAAMGMVSMIPGGQAIGALMGVNKLLGKGLSTMGVGTDAMTRSDAILDSPFLKLTPFGLVNAIGAKKTHTFEGDDESNEQIGSSYGGSLDRFADTELKSGKKYGLFSRKQYRKANDFIDESQRQQNLMTDIATNATNDFAASSNPFLQNRMQISRTGGFNNAAVGKEGMKIQNIDWAKALLQRLKQSQLQSFEQGGKMNIIPTGALHKELHHIDQKGITKKGIPVVVQSEGGEIEQTAEIEKQEIILHLDLTTAMEQYRDQYNESPDQEAKDSAAIEAGKILTQELLNNTIDKAKLIKSIE